jgi:hypothetical protein
VILDAEYAHVVSRHSSHGAESMILDDISIDGELRELQLLWMAYVEAFRLLYTMLLGHPGSSRTRRARLEALLKAVDILEQHLDYSETDRVMAMSMAHLSAPSKDYNVLQRHIDPSSTQQVIASSAARLDALSNAYNILQRRHRYSKTEGVTATFGSSSRSSLEGQHHTITASR